MSTLSSRTHDVCVIGSGFGGSMAARQLVAAGYDVVMLERGPWVDRGPHNWAPGATLDLTRYYNRDSAHRVEAGGNAPEMGGYHCVGGPSVFYGAVSLRYREADFAPPGAIVGDSGARWPFGYDELEPYYSRAEAVLDVAGGDDDPVGPRRSAPYPQAPAPLGGISAAIAGAGRDLGLQPFRLPLAINYRDNARRCVACATCDTYACAVNAKNDLATAVLPGLIGQGMTLLPETVVTGLATKGGRVQRALCVDKASGERFQVRAKWFVLAAGALASPQLVLASGLHGASPARDAVGRYLMRHVNGIVFGVFPRLPGPANEFHKQVGFHDFYFGGPGDAGGKLGCIQQLHTPPVALVEHFAPNPTHPIAVPVAKRMTGLLVMAEDEPRATNRVWVNGRRHDRYGLAQLNVHHRYTRRDLRARKALASQARRVLRRAGAVFFYHHKIATFSHAVGTLRMGPDAASAPVDPTGRFRGLANLSVTDGSILPTSAGLNPSLTIAANALRIGDILVSQELKE